MCVIRAVGAEKRRDENPLCVGSDCSDFHRLNPVARVTPWAQLRMHTWRIVVGYQTHRDCISNCWTTVLLRALGLTDESTAQSRYFDTNSVNSCSPIVCQTHSLWHSQDTYFRLDDNGYTSLMSGYTDGTLVLSCQRAP